MKMKNCEKDTCFILEKSEMAWKDAKDWHQIIREEDGMGTVEIILIIVVLVGLVLIFKEEITSIVENLFDKITKQTNKI